MESDGHSRGNPRIYELIEGVKNPFGLPEGGAPKTGKSPTIWAWPEVTDWFKIAGQPVPGPWPPHQEPRPNPEDESLPVAVVEPKRENRPRNEPQGSSGSSGSGSSGSGSGGGGQHRSGLGWMDD
jgi:uncharacterized membrane protein YgcG